MTPRQFAVEAYKLATGWLGWSDEAALHTPIPRIMAAYRETIERLKAVNGGDRRDHKPGENVTIRGDDADGLASLFDSKAT